MPSKTIARPGVICLIVHPTSQNFGRLVRVSHIEPMEQLTTGPHWHIIALSGELSLLYGAGCSGTCPDHWLMPIDPPEGVVEVLKVPVREKAVLFAWFERPIFPSKPRVLMPQRWKES
jgi:hypothetical protein